MANEFAPKATSSINNRSKLPKHVVDNEFSFGIGTLPSDNISKIITH